MLTSWGTGLGSLVDKREWGVGARVQGAGSREQGATLYPGIFDWVTWMRPNCSIPGALKSWLLMKRTFYCGIRSSIVATSCSSV
jgi:hypothetical protein